MSHTPGPWSLTPNGRHIYRVTQIGTIPIADVKDDMFSSTSAEEATANAHLIAAAPDLLSACECDVQALDRIATIVQQIRAGDTDTRNALDIIFDLASLSAGRIAIAKARSD